MKKLLEKYTMWLVAIAAIVLVLVGYSVMNGTEDTENVNAQTNQQIDVGYQLIETLVLTEGGTHVVSGTIVNGQIVIDAGEEEVVLVLNGVDITNASGAAVYVKESGDVTIELAEGSINVLTQTGLDDLEEEKAALYSTSDLKIEGADEAVLTVVSTVADGISSNDDLEIEDVTIMVTAADDGVRGKDSVTLKGATLTIDASDDGLKSTNDEEMERGWITISDTILTITAGDDGIHAETEVTINSGVVVILASYEGIEGFDVTINGGDITINSIDDGINVTDGMSASGSNAEVVTQGKPVDEVIDGVLTINGGIITITSDSDGLDSNGNIVMMGGTVIVYGPVTDREGAIDYNGGFDISGGTLVALGTARMAQTPADTSSQYSMLVSFDSILVAGTNVTIVDAGTGETIMDVDSAKEFQSVVYSAEELVAGNSYAVYLNGSTLFTTLTLDSVVTSYGAVVDAGPGGGRGRGGVPADG